MPGRISDQVIDQVREANDVVEVIGSYFPLKRRGHDFWATCPFHKEKTPSFSVSPTKQIWYCFGCHAGGNVFNFVMKYENLEFLDAVRRLAERAGIRIEWTETAGEPPRDQKELLFKLHDEVAAFYQESLRTAEIAKKYLEKRRISPEVARKWRIGYSPDAWDALIQWAHRRKYKAPLLETAGLALPRDSGGLYDRFRGRLMFPICDEQGRVVGFSGRILTDAKDQPKYVNSPETPIFQKCRILFALDKAKRTIIEEKVAIVCEGQVDTISCHEAGVANVVAPQGTALTEQHARILKRYAEEVVLMFDADAAGQNAVVRSAEPLWEAGIAIRVAVLPVGHDPDSFAIAFGADMLKNLVTKAPSFFVYLLESLSKQHDPNTDRGKVQIAKHLMAWLVRIPSPILRSTYIQQTATCLDVPEEAIRQELRRAHAKGRSVLAAASDECVDTSEMESSPNTESSPAEQLLLHLILVNESVLDVVVERLNRQWLTESVAGQLISRVTRLHAEGVWRGTHALLAGTVDEKESRLIAEVLLRPMAAGSQENIAFDCLATLERQWVAQGLRKLRKRLAQADLTISEKDKLLRQMLDLQPKLRNIRPLSMEKYKPSAP